MADDRTFRPTSASWASSTGNAWVALQGVLDDLYRPVEQALVEAVAGLGPRHVVDVGCGTGPTTVAIARATGARCVGVDVSGSMVEAGRRRDTTGLDVEFVVADAQTHAFGPPPFDVVASRFGVMFFDDPVAAFANLRAAARPGGGLRTIVWRGPEENPFMTTAESAADGVLAVPVRDTSGPDPFSLSDPSRVQSVLGDAGWQDVGLEALDLPCDLASADLGGYLTRLGPVGRALADAGADEAELTRVADALRPAFDRFLDGDRLRFTAACWMVSAAA